MIRNLIDYSFDALAVALVVAAVLLMTSCNYIDTARNFTGEQAARAVEVECGLSVEERQKNVVAINTALAGRGLPNRVTAFDCDGDDKPDF
jgi:hypothetical protein